jgi:hypothetical protein
MLNRETSAQDLGVRRRNPLWDEYRFEDQTPFYVNPYTMQLTLDFPLSRPMAKGGILADEMGELETSRRVRARPEAPAQAWARRWRPSALSRRHARPRGGRPPVRPLRATGRLDSARPFLPPSGRHTGGGSHVAASAVARRGGAFHGPLHAGLLRRQYARLAHSACPTLRDVCMMLKIGCGRQVLTVAAAVLRRGDHHLRHPHRRLEVRRQAGKLCVRMACARVA